MPNSLSLHTRVPPQRWEALERARVRVFFISGEDCRRQRARDPQNLDWPYSGWYYAAPGIPRVGPFRTAGGCAQEAYHKLGMASHPANNKVVPLKKGA